MLLRWWHDDFLGWDLRYRNEAISPVQTRLSYYASSVKAQTGPGATPIDPRHQAVHPGR